MPDKNVEEFLKQRHTIVLSNGAIYVLDVDEFMELHDKFVAQIDPRLVYPSFRNQVVKKGV